MKNHFRFSIAIRRSRNHRPARRILNPASEIPNPKLLALLLLPFLLLSCGALWQTDANTAVEMARTGQYKEAAAVLEAAVAKGNVEQPVVEGLYYSWIRQGEYEKTRERFESWSTEYAKAGPIRLSAARVNHIVGNQDRALTHLEPILSYSDVGIAAQFEKAQVLDGMGKREDANAIYQRMITAFQDGIIRAPRDLFWVARAMWATEYFHDANDVFKMVAEADPRNAELFVAWGDLLAEKYNEPEAIASYQDALKIDPNMPEAQVGLARTYSLSDPEKASKALEAALRINPNSIDGNLLVVEQDIDSEQFDKAVEDVKKVFAVNPQSIEALSLLASIHFLRDNKTEFNSYVERVLQANPLYSELFYTLADNCVSVRLYDQAVTFAREAIRLNPRDWKAMSLLGVNLLRLGQETEGKAMLEKAYEGDPFNVWNVNTLRLLGSFPKFDRFETPHFRVMLHKKESAALRPYVTELLEKAHKVLSAKYEFTPSGPIVFEMYPDHADFAVRTLGLPGIGALGVCFGRLFVMDSPSARKPDEFNWGSTLWHEFAHVITLQITDHKVPRWFSEGLSVFEERKAFPGWGDDLKIEYLGAIKGKKLLPIAELNNGFIRPKFPEQVLVSYYQASIICDFIESKYGFAAIRQMLALYKGGKNTAEVFKGALNITLDQFDTDFFKWVDDKVRGIEIPVFTKLISSGQEQFAKGDTDAAIETLKSAIEMYPEYSDEHNAYEPLADAYLKKGDKPAAIEVLRKFLTYSETSYRSYLKLAELLEEKGDLPGAVQALEGSIYVRPLDMQDHQKLGDILLTQKQWNGAAREFETLVALNPPDRAGAYYRLAQAYLGQGNNQEARKNVLKSLEIAPSFEPAQELLLKIVR